MLLVRVTTKVARLPAVVWDVGPRSPKTVIVIVEGAVVRAAKPATTTALPLRVQVRLDAARAVAAVAAVSPVTEHPLQVVEL